MKIKLNSNVPVFQELSKNINAYLMRWDEAYAGYGISLQAGCRAKTYFENHARMVCEKMKQESVLNAKTLIRQKNSGQWVWENQIKPLF